MQYDEYKFKFYLNASHSIFINGVLGEEHPHTWEITIYTIKFHTDFVIFNDVERYVEKYMKKYQDSYINRIEPFITLNPTLENMCKFFKDNMKALLAEKGWILLSIEISETPTRSYVIDLSREAELKYGLNFEKEDILEEAAINKVRELKNHWKKM
ncbi:6-pyruvoyl tetrahydrobiopterin synthase [Clostridium acetobutylicum]|nr:6-pyruvoyl tetrahydrobiopterin synthase [Clostridium acetobutylicum]